MRMIRFIAADGREILGDDHGDGTATVLGDPKGVLLNDCNRTGLESLRGKRALVADDDENVRRIVSTVLSRAGCDCLVCTDGAEAMEAIDKELLDLVVSDIMMPHHDGYEIFAAAKSHFDNIPILLITGFGYDPNHSLVRASAEGLEAVLYKPFTPTQLLDSVQQIVDGLNGSLSETIVRTSERIEIGRMLPPIAPPNVICVGRNYRQPGGTLEPPTPDDLEVFLKPTTALRAHERPIRLPRVDDGDPLVDCEGELAVVIGRYTRDVDEEVAMQRVVGLTIANDVTARRFQDAGPGRWMRGKGFDTFCPIGPGVVTLDEVADPQCLQITTRVNDVVVQQGSTADMLRPINVIISELSRRMTLAPGTVILTGAPPRLGEGPTVLQPGDVVSIEIESLGTLVNAVAEP